MLTFQDLPIPGPEVLQYGDNGFAFFVVSVFALTTATMAVFGYKIVNRVTQKSEKDQERSSASVDKLATAMESLATSHRDLNTTVKLLMQQSRNDAKQILNKLDGST